MLMKLKREELLSYHINNSDYIPQSNTLTLYNNCLHFLLPEARHFNRSATNLTGLHTSLVLLKH